MPDIDPLSPYAHVIQLAREYVDLIELVEQGGLETDDIRELQGQRSVLHDQIIAEFDRLNIPYTDRDNVRARAFQFAKWLPAPEEDDDV